MKNLKNLLIEKQNLENRLTQINTQIFEIQFNVEPIRQLQEFSSNDSTLESIRDELLITLNDSDINQFLTTFA
jgi:hypothetical protein